MSGPLAGIRVLEVAMYGFVPSAVTTRMPTGDRSRAATGVMLTTPPLAAA